MRWAKPAEARQHVIVNNHHAKRSVPDDDRPEAERDIDHADRRAQGDAGDDARQRQRQDQQERDRFPSEELSAVNCSRGCCAQYQGDQRGDDGHPQR